MSLALIVGTTLGAVDGTSAQNPKIEGVWRALTVEGGKKIPGNYSIQKIYTKDQFVVVLAEGDSVIECVSGTYTFDGKKLTEKFEKVTPGTRHSLGQTMVGEVVFDGQKMSQDGAMKGSKENSTWERVE